MSNASRVATPVVGSVEDDAWRADSGFRRPRNGCFRLGYPSWLAMQPVVVVRSRNRLRCRGTGQGSRLAPTLRRFYLSPRVLDTGLFCDKTQALGRKTAKKSSGTRLPIIYER